MAIRSEALGAFAMDVSADIVVAKQLATYILYTVLSTGASEEILSVSEVMTPELS